MAIDFTSRKITVYLRVPSPLVEFTDETNSAVHVAIGPVAIAGTCAGQDERGLEIRPVEWATDGEGESFEAEVLSGGAFVPWHSVASILFGTATGSGAGAGGGDPTGLAGGGAGGTGAGGRPGGIAPGLGGRPGFGRR